MTVHVDVSVWVCTLVEVYAKVLPCSCIHTHTHHSQQLLGALGSLQKLADCCSECLVLNHIVVCKSITRPPLLEDSSRSTLYPHHSQPLPSLLPSPQPAQIRAHCGMAFHTSVTELKGQLLIRYGLRSSQGQARFWGWGSKVM